MINGKAPPNDSVAAIVVASSTTSSLCSSSSSYLMDAMFQLDNNGRSSFLQFLMQSSGAAYICLWSYLPPARCLCSIDGYYQEQSGNPSSSFEGLPGRGRLFHEYKNSLIIVENNHSHIPGFAYWSDNPYVELREDEIGRMVMNNNQRQFYQEARIKIVVFMGCRSGEIELGFSTMFQVDLQMQMRNLFIEDFSRHERFLRTKIEQQNPHSSSSSTMDSTEYSSLLFDLPQETSNELISISDQVLDRVLNLQFPTLLGSEQESAMAKAFLAVISSPSSSSSSSQQMQKQANPRASAFGLYSVSASTPQIKLNVRKRENPLKQSINYFRGLHLVRSRDRQMSLRAATTQLQHMMSERKRRERLNDSFLALKSLLPSETKKDRGSILTTTTEYLTSLKNQIDDLREKNVALEAQLSASKIIIDDKSSETISDVRFDVQVRHIRESTLTEDHRTVELQVLVRGECPSLQLVIGIFKLMKQMDNVKITSMDSGTRVSGPDIVNRVNLRLRIEGNEWDKAAFEEAVRKMVADVAA